MILARHLVSGASGDKAVSVPVDSGALEQLSEVVVSRAQRVAPQSADDVRDALAHLIATWQGAVEDSTVLQYPRWAQQGADVKGLIIPAGSTGMDSSTGEPLAEIFPPSEPPWPTLMSLRNVDRESTLKIIANRPTKAATNGDH